MERESEHDLIRDGEQIIQSIDLECGARQAPTAMHHTMEEALMLRVERAQRGDDGIPGVGAPGIDPIAADLASEHVILGVNAGYEIEDAHVLCEPGCAATIRSAGADN